MPEATEKKVTVRETPRAEEAARHPRRRCRILAPSPQGDSVGAVLRWLKQQIEDPDEHPEGKAKEELVKDLAALTSEYEGVPEIVAKYAKTHKLLLGPMRDEAKRQLDDIISWTDDEVPPPLVAAINKLHQGYDLLAEELDRQLDRARGRFHRVKSCLDRTKANVEDRQDDFKRQKDYEKTAKGWSDDMKSLHGEAKSYLEEENFKALYAVRKEFEKVWEKLLGLSEHHPDWLKNELNRLLRAWISDRWELYYRHRDWLGREQALVRAREAWDAFEKNRRKDFIREAQDVPSAGPAGARPTRGKTSSVAA